MLLPRLYQLPATVSQLNILTQEANQLGFTPAQIINVNQESGPDRLLSVEMVRDLIGQSTAYYRSPVQVVFLLLHLENASLEAQNTLLKLLEEPPAGAAFLLGTSDQSAVLETIISRCQVIVLAEVIGELNLDLTEYLTTFAPEQLLTASEGQLIGQIDQFFSQTAAELKTSLDQADEESKTSLERRATEQLLRRLAEAYLERPNQTSVLLLPPLQTAFTYLQANVNPRAVLEDLFFQLKAQLVV